MFKVLQFRYKQSVSHLVPSSRYNVVSRSKMLAQRGRSAGVAGDLNHIRVGLKFNPGPMHFRNAATRFGGISEFAVTNWDESADTIMRLPFSPSYSLITRYQNMTREHALIMARTSTPHTGARRAASDGLSDIASLSYRPNLVQEFIQIRNDMCHSNLVWFRDSNKYRVLRVRWAGTSTGTGWKKKVPSRLRRYAVLKLCLGIGNRQLIS